MNNLLTLRGVILSQYKTIGDFAKAMGWKRNKASRIINGIQEPSNGEIRQPVEVLEITQDAFMDIFFASMFTKCTNRDKSA